MIEKTVNFFPEFTGTKPDSLCFRTGNGTFEDQGSLGPSALCQFYDRLLLGQSFPSRLILNQCYTLDVPMAYLLFRKPELAVEPATSQLVRNIDLYHRLGVVSLTAMSEHDRTFLGRVQGMLPSPLSDSPASRINALYQTTALLEEELRLCYMAPEELPFAHDKELQGFISYKTLTPHLVRVYENFYQGGLWCGPETAMIFKRSNLVEDLPLDKLMKSMENGPLQGVWLQSDSSTLMSRQPLTEDHYEETWRAMSALLTGEDL